jgi:hypothetical protein
MRYANKVICLTIFTTIFTFIVSLSFTLLTDTYAYGLLPHLDKPPKGAESRFEFAPAFKLAGALST